MYYGNLKKNFHLIRLFKKLASSAWGEIQNKKSIWKTEDDIIHEKLDIGFGFENMHMPGLYIPWSLQTH
jgi:hypothetical protein